MVLLQGHPNTHTAHTPSKASTWAWSQGRRGGVVQHYCRRLVLWFSCRVIQPPILHIVPQKRLPELGLRDVEEESPSTTADDSSSGSLVGSYLASNLSLRSSTQKPSYLPHTISTIIYKCIRERKHLNWDRDALISWGQDVLRSWDQDVLRSRYSAELRPRCNVELSSGFVCSLLLQSTLEEEIKPFTSPFQIPHPPTLPNIHI